MKTESPSTEGRRSYNSPARTAQKAETRQRILDALSVRLAEGTFDSASMEEIAAAASVAPATLYRYFPSREALLDGITGEFDHRVSELPAPWQVDDIGRVAAQTFATFDANAGLVRAFFATNLGQLARSRGRMRRIDTIRQALLPLTEGMDEPRNVGAVAVIAYLSSLQAWITISDEFALPGAQVGRAVAWAIDTLIEDLKAHKDR